jgi:pimeloyl-ACP methyl ester carboxylesterase
MVDRRRRELLKAGAAAAAAAATPSVLAQQSGGASGGRFYQKGNVRIQYDETGSGFPLLLIAGGGLNGSTIAGIRGGNPFNAIDAFKGEFRCIYADLRNAAGQSTGPLEVERPWDSHTDDHIGLMDHLGIDKFMVLGFCIAGPFIWNLIKRAPNRVVAAVPAQPVGFRPELPTALYDSQKTSWGAELVKRRSDITETMADQFLTKMFRTNPDFVFTVTRDFVKSCQTPVLVLPDDTAGHSLTVAIESAMLAPKGQLSMYPWKDTPDKIPLAVRHVRSFLLSHRTASW